MEYLPATQREHNAAPAVFLYFPATHAVHVPPFVPVYPRLQRQLALRVLPLGEFENVGQLTHEISAEAPGIVEYVPTPQSVHDAEPVVDFHVPAAHVLHVPPSGPVVPVLQTQLVCAVDPTTDCEFALQSVHDAEPVVGFHVPAAHAVHEPAEPVDPGPHDAKQGEDDGLGCSVPPGQG